MSLAAPRLQQLPTSSVHPGARCPPSPPPPVFSVTTAFFQSPFSVSSSNTNSATHRIHANQTPPRNSPSKIELPHASSMSSSPICTATTIAGHRNLARLIDEDDDPAQGEGSTHPSMSLVHHSQHVPNVLNSTPRNSSGWTPLSSRTCSLQHPQQPTPLSTTTTTSTEDRLDRLLAEMERDSPSKSFQSILSSSSSSLTSTSSSTSSPSSSSSSSSTSTFTSPIMHNCNDINGPHHNTGDNDTPNLSQKTECWELSSFETRFHPVHHDHSTPLRPCLKTRSTSVSSSVSVASSTVTTSSLLTSASTISSRSEEALSSSSSTDQSPSLLPDKVFILDHELISDHHLHPIPQQQNQQGPLFDHDNDDDDHHHLDQDRSNCNRVRFNDDQVEETLTWSRESYDRRGSPPIRKLNVRDIIELRLIKEELGISTSSTPTPI